jgi:predicted phosphodiesterase
MKIQIMSDLHHEFGHRVELTPDKNCILILAGDIDTCPIQIEKFVTEAASLYHSVIMVSGNHEYYKSNMKSMDAALDKVSNKLDNFYYLNNSSVCIEGQLFLGTTLWTNVGGDYFNHVKWRKMSDSSLIRPYKKAHLLSIDDVQSLNDLARSFLTMSLAKTVDNNTIVITHHGPTEELADPKYAKSQMNQFFFNSGLDWLFPSIKTWIFGHTHSSIDTSILGCRFICNPYGYHKYEVNKEFNKDKIVEL